MSVAARKCVQSTPVQVIILTICMTLGQSLSFLKYKNENNNDNRINNNGSNEFCNHRSCYKSSATVYFKFQTSPTLASDPTSIFIHSSP